jgi:hypothetical protein
MEDPCGFVMSGGGTSSSTPQIAAACALWLLLYRDQLPADWHRVEACRIALFDSADNQTPDKPKLGWGTLKVKKMLDARLAANLIERAKAGYLRASAEDSWLFPFWRLIMGIGPPGSEEERMYETEVGQVVLQSRNSDLLRATREAADGAIFEPTERARLRKLLLAEKISNPLRKQIA